MSTSRRAIAVLIALMAGAPAQAQAPSSPVAVQNAWARATSQSATSGGIFVTLTPGTTPDRLVGAETPASMMAQVHETTESQGVMKMQAVSAVPLIPGQPVTLKPGGLHIMLMGLKQPLKPGDHFPVTLVFEKAGRITTDVTVQSAGASGPAMAMPGHDMSPTSLPTRP